jgi:hypothetical protein
MASEDVVMVIDKPHFTVKVHSTLLEVDVKEGFRKDLESFIESRPALRESLGLLFQTVVPLDVKLRDIQSVDLDKKGRLKIAIPMRKDITIPLDEAESRRLIDKLNELIPKEKERAQRDKEEAAKAEKAFGSKRAVMDRELARERTEH